MSDRPEVTIDADYVRSIEERRARSREALRGPTSVLAAVARHEVPVGSSLRFGPSGDVDVRLPGMDRVVSVSALADALEVDGEVSPPRTVEAGRFALRLSHQNYPAVVVLDSHSPGLKQDVELRWYPVDPALRLRAEFAPDRAPQSIGSTASGDRPAERAGWATLSIGGTSVRLSLTHMLEPGFAPDHLDLYFRDGTTGDGSYDVGRYVTVEHAGDGSRGVIVDFNRAYNPSCALSPFYNCPIPPHENRISFPIRAGEMAPLHGTTGGAAH
ncbi:MAG: DUF1684 domain-containing protein [Chloroflexota bacterium]|nr:DUF1684 domain-containing protein [Chloroflexota bacterium]